MFIIQFNYTNLAHIFISLIYNYYYVSNFFQTAGANVLLFEITGNEKYKSSLDKFLDYVIKKAPKTPKGLVHLGDWGSLR